MPLARCNADRQDREDASERVLVRQQGWPRHHGIYSCLVTNAVRKQSPLAEAFELTIMPAKYGQHAASSEVMMDKSTKED